MKTKNSNILNSELEIGLQKFVDSCPFYIMIIDEHHKVLIANKAVEKIFDINHKAIIGEYCPASIHGVNEYFSCPLGEAVKSKMPVEREVYDEKIDSWLNISIYPLGIKSKEGHELFVHMCHDISDKIMAYEELKDNYKIQNILMELLNISLLNITFEEKLNRILKKIFMIPWFITQKKGAVFLVDKSPNVLEMKAEYGLDDKNKEFCRWIEFGQCICGRAAMSEKMYPLKKSR